MATAGWPEPPQGTSVVNGIMIFNGAGHPTRATIADKPAKGTSMPPQMIIPNYKLLISYDIRPTMTEKYYYYVLKEFVPELETMGLYMLKVWHVAYGDYPIRQLEFVTEDLDMLRDVLASERWNALESHLKTLTTNYERKVVRFRKGYQF
jgi:hypothetical protein